jgi:threonine/homoserine/homoserine lactone efflux protein
VDDLVFLEAFLLFVAPGPTNALLMAGSIKRANAIKLLAAQACGYGVASAWWLSLRPFVSPDAIQILRLVAAGWLVVLGLRLTASARINVSKNGDAISVAATSALNPKAFIYCLAIVPMNIEPRTLGIFWVALLVMTAATGSVWLLLGRRFSGGKRMAERVAGAALIAFALLLVRPLILLVAI